MDEYTVIYNDDDLNRNEIIVQANNRTELIEVLNKKGISEYGHIVYIIRNNRFIK